MQAIENDGWPDVLRHPNPDNYSTQLVFVVAIERDAYFVPFVEEDDH
ncbi:MAG TPA: hypothetical protein VFB54_10070 [Burkholderiales bacterium]|nr:hypothetical protein [Burkholderiales bacterium]